MSTTNVNNTTSGPVNKNIAYANGSMNITGNSITRLMKNFSGVDILPFQPFINAGWDDTENCMIVSLPYGVGNVIIGIMISGIPNNSVRSVDYVSNGLIRNVDTSSWLVNDFIYAKSDGTFTNQPTINLSTTIPQEIALVMRSDSIMGEVYVSTSGNQTKFIASEVIIPAVQNYGFITDRGNISFYQSSAPTFALNGLKVGDFWFDTSISGAYSMKRCSATSPTVSWDKISVDMDGNGLYAGYLTTGQIISGTFDIARLPASVTGNNQTFYQNTAPTVVTNNLKIGDIWFNTSSSTIVMNRCSAISPSVAWAQTSVYMDGNGAYIGALDAGQIIANSTFSNNLNVGSVFTVGSATVSGTIKSYGYDGSVNGFQIVGGSSPSFTIIGGSFKSGTILIGSGNSAFRADTNGIYLGNSTFASAPFRVDLSGNVYASGVYINGHLETGTGSIINGVYIDSIDAGKINVGTLTGFTMQTAASGQRVVISNADQVKFYDSNGTLSGSILGIGGGLQFTGISYGADFFTSGTGGSYASQTGATFIAANINSTQTITIDGMTGGISCSSLSISGSTIASQSWVSGQGFVTGTPWTSMGYLTAVPSGYTGGSSIATVGTITSGTWTGTAIGDSYISSAGNWNDAHTKTYSMAGLTGLIYCNGTGTFSAVTNNSSNWNTAYGWGNHASAGYLTAETDPTIYSWAKASTKPSYAWSEVTSKPFDSMSSMFTEPAGVLTINQSNTSTNGYLSSTDWNTFNNKQPALSWGTTGGATSPSGYVTLTIGGTSYKLWYQT
jgi:hypothetical protein